jgi:hypothetical protein
MPTNDAILINENTMARIIKFVFFKYFNFFWFFFVSCFI